MQVAGKQSGKRQIFCEINITPLTDIFLVLLIIMMVVAPMIQQMRQDIKPPQMVNGKPLDQGRLTVEVTKDGNYYLEGVETPVTGLAEAFKAKADHLVEKNIIIRADKETKSGTVLKIFDAARDAQFEKVTVAGESLSDVRQEQLHKGLNSEGNQ
jgi:biopolymer transport protein ExbD/biopolymer transport protein TolR